jgi:hypothetical protein
MVKDQFWWWAVHLWVEGAWEVKANYNRWFWVFRAILGAGVVIGVAIFVYDFFKTGREPAPALQAAKVRA